MTLRIKCKQCGFDHISNIYRLEEHNFHRNFSNLESCPTVDMYLNVMNEIINLN